MQVKEPLTLIILPIGRGNTSKVSSAAEQSVANLSRHYNEKGMALTVSYGVVPPPKPATAKTKGIFILAL